MIVACRLTPKGGRDALDGVATLSDGTVVLACRVREAPEDGLANAALCRLIASAAGAPPSRARVAAGAKSRLKQIALQGDVAALAAALARSCGGDARISAQQAWAERAKRQRALTSRTALK